MVNPRWAGDDLRSLNGQMEYLLRRALREAGRLPAPVQRREDGQAISDDAAATDTAGDGSDAAAVPAVQMRSEPQ